MNLQLHNIWHRLSFTANI